jgi:cytochrome c oxidase cbb3-type subunit 2
MQSAAPALLLGDWAMSPAATRGRKSYARWCIGCHGDEGLGDGKASEWMSPKPRNFQKGFFKFRTTPSGALPTAEDVMKVVTRGLPGSAMPSFELVSEGERRDLVAWVLHLAGFGVAKLEAEVLRDSEKLTREQILANHLPALRAAVDARFATATPIVLPPETPADEASLQRGRARYAKECAACHGVLGLGDGTSSTTLRDWQGAAILPRDFSTGVFRAGSSNADLYVRLKTGLMGTPMPSISGTDADLWDLVHTIRSFVTAPHQGASR